MKLPFLALAMTMLFNAPGHALADDYGCKVLLCLADPQGPMTQNECRPPIQRMITGQNKKPADPFPSCPEGKPATMQPGVRPYDACPVDTTALPQDSSAVQLSAEMFRQLTAQPTRPGFEMTGPGGVPLSGSGTLPPGVIVQFGIGEGEAMPDGQKNKICVGKQLGALAVIGGTNDLPTISTVAVYEQVAILAPVSNPRVVDVYIDGKLFKSTRY